MEVLNSDHASVGVQYNLVKVNYVINPDWFISAGPNMYVDQTSVASPQFCGPPDIRRLTFMQPLLGHSKTK